MSLYLYLYLYIGLRLLDDIQPSTVLSAVKLTKVLLDHVLHACNPQECEASDVQRCIEIILPIILDSLQSATAEVRGAYIHTYIHTYIYTYIHKHTLVHAYIYIHINNTYINIHIIHVYV